MTDYYSILSRAVASLEPNTAQTRALLFERARQVLVREFQNHPDRWTNAQAAAELAQFDNATDHVEFDTAKHAAQRTTRREESMPGDATIRQPKSGLRRVAVVGAIGLLGFALLGVVLHLGSGSHVSVTEPSNRIAATSARDRMEKASSRVQLIGNDLEPGVDGGATDSGLPYYLRRQAVYYRTVYSTDMIVVDRSQRFLYLVQPQARAIRYGIGVGGECALSTGLHRIQSKLHWPEWSPTPALLKRYSFAVRVPGGPGNPLGTYAMYFENNVAGIHGTNAPRSIGHAPAIGCFRLINDDVVDLEKRVPVGTGVVVQN